LSSSDFDRKAVELRLNPNQDCLGHVLTAAGYETSFLE
jgi:hypothetical protein